MPKDGTTFEELYKQADEALYTTKRNGRDGFRIYHEVEEKKYRYFIQIPRKNLLIFRKFNGIKGEDMVLCCM